MFCPYATADYCVTCCKLPACRQRARREADKLWRGLAKGQDAIRAMLDPGNLMDMQKQMDAAFFCARVVLLELFIRKTEV